MKKVLTAVLTCVMSLMFVFLCTACGSNNDSGNIDVDTETMKETYGDWTDKALEVAVCDKGLGTEWAKDAARYFNAGTGSKIVIKADETLNESLSTFLDAKSGFDVYFSFSSQLQWLQWARSGKIYSLDDLGLNYSESCEKLGVYNGVRYTMPYSFAPTGFIYNQNYIDEIPSNGEFVQGQFPSTWQGLLDMCDSVNEKWNKTALGQKVVPMSYGGSVGDMKYIFYGLWAQIDPVGFENYWNQQTTVITNDNNKSLLVNDNVIKAVDCIAKLFNTKENSKGNYYPSNAFSDSTSHSNLMAEQKFLNGLSVFTISGSWFENEMREQIEEGELDFYHFAAAPKANKDNATAIYMNSPAEYFMIAANGKNNNPELAKAFLRFMATEERCRVFQAYTGVPAALKYKMQPDTLEGFAKEVALSLDGVTLAVAASDQVASLTAAIDLDVKTMFLELATTKYSSTLARTKIEGLYEKQVANWGDHIKESN